MNLTNHEFHSINASNVHSLFLKFDEHYKGMGAIHCLRHGLTQLADYMKTRAEHVYYAKLNIGRDRFEENFSLCVNHHVRMSVKSTSMKTGSMQSTTLKPFSTLKVFQDFVSDMAQRCDPEVAARIHAFFDSVIKVVGQDYLLELHYGEGEFDFIATNKNIAHHFEIYLELL